MGTLPERDDFFDSTQFSEDDDLFHDAYDKLNSDLSLVGGGSSVGGEGYASSQFSDEEGYTSSEFSYEERSVEDENLEQATQELDDISSKSSISVSQCEDAGSANDATVEGKARLKIEENNRLKAEEEARVKEEEEAQIAAKEEETKAEEERCLKIEEEARLKAEETNKSFEAATREKVGVLASQETIEGNILSISEGGKGVKSTTTVEEEALVHAKNEVVFKGENYENVKMAKYNVDVETIESEALLGEENQMNSEEFYDVQLTGIEVTSTEEEGKPVWDLRSLPAIDDKMAGRPEIKVQNKKQSSPKRLPNKKQSSPKRLQNKKQSSPKYQMGIDNDALLDENSQRAASKGCGCIMC